MSITIAAAFATILLAMAQALNIPLKFTEDELAKILMALFTAISGAVAWYGRVRIGDVDGFGRKHTPDADIDSLPDDEL